MKSLSLYIIEKYGMSDDVKNCTDEILQYIKDNISSVPKQHTFSFNKGIFKQIVVDFNEKVPAAAFVPFDSSAKDNMIKIILNPNFINDIDNNDLYISIVHELTHGLEYVNMQNKNIERKNSEKYYVAAKYLMNDEENDKKGLNLKKFFHQFTYLNERSERLAFLSMIYKEIESLAEKIGIERFKRKIKTYKSYIDIAELIEDPYIIWLYNIKVDFNQIKKDTWYKKEFVNTYNKIYNENKTYNQIIKYIELKLNKFEKKLNDIIPKIIFDVINKIENKDKNQEDTKTKLKKYLDENK